MTIRVSCGISGLVKPSIRTYTTGSAAKTMLNQETNKKICEEKAGKRPVLFIVHYIFLSMIYCS